MMCIQTTVRKEEAVSAVSEAATDTGQRLNSTNDICKFQFMNCSDLQQYYSQLLYLFCKNAAINSDSPTN